MKTPCYFAGLWLGALSCLWWNSLPPFLSLCYLCVCCQCYFCTFSDIRIYFFSGLPFGKLVLSCKQCIYCCSDYVWKPSTDLKQFYWKECWSGGRGRHNIKQNVREKKKEFLPNTCRLRLECVSLLGASGRTGNEALWWANATNLSARRTYLQSPNSRSLIMPGVGRFILLPTHLMA